MKQFIFTFVTLFFLMETSSAQDSVQHIEPKASVSINKVKPPVKYTSEYYAIKSSKYRTTGWVLSSLGTVFIVSGYFLYKNRKEDYTLNQLGEGIANSVGPQILMIVGSTMVLISIPVFISSGSYKRKALSMSAILKLENRPDLYQTGISMNNYPAVGLKIQL